MYIKLDESNYNLNESVIARAKKPSLTLNLGTNGLKVTSEPPPMAGQAGRLQGQDRSAVTCPSSSYARRCLIWLSCDNRRTTTLRHWQECCGLPELPALYGGILDK
ncbi:hypothetical protein J6590_085743 [Homalodisca vitripennis]|nr:hypothetical protein J6590_085743 [Homalodisca vitripennis]